MSIRTAYFNNVAFNTLGLIINETVVPPVSHQKYSTISIPDGPVIFEETGERDPVVFSIKCTVTEANKLRSIYALTEKPGILILPDETDKYYYGVLTIDTPYNIILYYNKITFTMTAEPYAYAISNPEIICTLQTEEDHHKTVVNNTGTAECEPIYRITATSSGKIDLWIDVGSITHSVSITNVSEGEVIVIDVSKRTVKNENGTNKADKVTGDYTKLTIPSGQRTIRVRNASVLKITMNKRWY